MDIASFPRQTLTGPTSQDTLPSCTSTAWKGLEVTLLQSGTHCLAELYWTAPELLRLRESPCSGTPQGDVYSFAILLRDLIHQQAHGPFEDLEAAPEGKAGVCCWRG
jgi:hypothetical protein